MLFICNFILSCKHYLLLQQDLVVVPATRHLLPSDQEYMMRYIPLHKLNVNDSHKLIVRNVSQPLMQNTSNHSGSCYILVMYVAIDV